MSASDIINRSYMASAEPSWAKRITDWQLLGILNLSALLTPTIYLSDVHLGDNSHIFNSYLNRSETKLYRQIVELSKVGVLFQLLRDRTIRPHHTNAEFPVASFEDVYQSWKQMDPSQAFINQDTSDAREKFFKSLDLDLPRASTLRYDYAAVKRKFISDVREAANVDQSGWFQSALKTLNAQQRQEYDRILRQDWFSLSDIYNFLQSTGQKDVGLSALFAHGLLNEGAYSKTIDCDLTGFDTEEAFVQERIWRPDPVSKLQLGEKGTAGLEERADAAFDSPSLSLLALLTPDQIVEIRAMGNSYFDFAAHRKRTGADPTDISFQRDFLYHASNYWQSICEYIAERHPGGAMKPRRLILFLGQLPVPFSKISEKAFRFTLSLGSESAIGGDVPGLKMAISRIVQFIFLSDTDEMEKLRKLLPFGVWSRQPPSGKEMS
jgi:hypothetical protein